MLVNLNVDSKKNGMLPMIVERKEMIERWKLLASAVQLHFHGKAKQFTSRPLILN